MCYLVLLSRSLRFWFAEGKAMERLDTVGGLTCEKALTN